MKWCDIFIESVIAVISDALMFAFRFVMPDLTVMYHLACLSVCLPLCRDILRDILQSSVSDHRLSTVAHYLSLSLSLSLSLYMSLCVCVCVCVCVFVTSQVALVRDIAHALSDHTRRVRCDIPVSITIKNIMIIKTEVRSFCVRGSLIEGNSRHGENYDQ